MGQFFALRRVKFPGADWHCGGAPIDGPIFEIVSSDTAESEDRAFTDTHSGTDSRLRRDPGALPDMDRATRRYAGAEPK